MKNPHNIFFNFNPIVLIYGRNLFYDFKIRGLERHFQPIVSWKPSNLKQKNAEQRQSIFPKKPFVIWIIKLFQVNQLCGLQKYGNHLNNYRKKENYFINRYSQVIVKLNQIIHLPLDREMNTNHDKCYFCAFKRRKILNNFLGFWFYMEVWWIFDFGCFSPSFLEVRQKLLI